MSKKYKSYSKEDKLFLLRDSDFDWIQQQEFCYYLIKNI